jgi:hypothetical protein
MGFGLIGYLVTHAWAKHENTVIFKFCVKLAAHAQKDMAFCASMICQITRCVFDHADADFTKDLRAPIGDTAFTWMLGTGNIRPISRPERYGIHLHEESFEVG